MKCDDGVTHSKLRQGSCGLGHLRLDNVDDILTDRYVLDVEGFVVVRTFTLALVMHFSQQISDLIAHHAAASHVRIHEQRPRRFPHHHFKGFVDIDQTPVAIHAQFHHPIVDGPKDGVALLVEHVRRADVQGGDAVVGEHLLDVGSQLGVTVHTLSLNPSHLLGQLLVEQEFGSTAQCTGSNREPIVDYQILAFHEKIHVGFLPVVGQVARTLFGTVLVVDATLLEKRHHGFHEPHPVHVVEHSLHIARVERGHAGRGGAGTVDPDPFVVGQGGVGSLGGDQGRNRDLGVGQGDGTQPHFPSRPFQTDGMR